MLPNKKVKFSNPATLEPLPSAGGSMPLPPTDPTTPTHLRLSHPAAELSPPDSHGGVSMTANGQRGNTTRNSKVYTSENGNPNGKRPLGDTQSSSSGGAKYLHKSSGYTWNKAEDEPGHSWKGKRTLDDYTKAMEQIIAKHRLVGNRYDLPIGEGDLSDKYE